MGIAATGDPGKEGQVSCSSGRGRRRSRCGAGGEVGVEDGGGLVEERRSEGVVAAAVVVGNGVGGGVRQGLGRQNKLVKVGSLLLLLLLLMMMLGGVSEGLGMLHHRDILTKNESEDEEKDRLSYSLSSLPRPPLPLPLNSFLEFGKEGSKELLSDTHWGYNKPMREAIPMHPSK